LTTISIIYTIEVRVRDNVQTRKLEQMKLATIHCTGYLAQQAGFMPTSWSLKNPSDNREILVSGFREGWDD
jgi:hypothetical protein